MEVRLGLYGSASHVNGGQRRHLGLRQGLPVHCGGLRPLCTHRKLLLQRTPGGGTVRGAAIATVIGNVAGALYYLRYFSKGVSMLSIHPRNATLRNGVCTGVLAIGIPASLASLLMSVFQIVMLSKGCIYDMICNVNIKMGGNNIRCSEEDLLCILKQYL